MSQQQKEKQEAALLEAHRLAALDLWITKRLQQMVKAELVKRGLVQ